MFPKLNPHNNDWNRKYDFNEESGTGFLMDTKNGLTYFAWKSKDDSVKFYKCEQSVFEKSFDMTSEIVEHEIDPFDNIRYLRYPMEL